MSLRTGLCEIKKVAIFTEMLETEKINSIMEITDKTVSIMFWLSSEKFW